jgi:hypothetical protein
MRMIIVTPACTADIDMHHLSARPAAQGLATRPVRKRRADVLLLATADDRQAHLITRLMRVERIREARLGWYRLPIHGGNDVAGLETRGGRGCTRGDLGNDHALHVGSDAELSRDRGCDVHHAHTQERVNGVARTDQLVGNRFRRGDRDRKPDPLRLDSGFRLSGNQGINADDLII